MSILDQMEDFANKEENELHSALKNLYKDEESIGCYGDLASSNAFIQNGFDKMPIRLSYLQDGDPEDDASDYGEQL